MIEIKKWLNDYLKIIDINFKDRVWFVGLQGSYARGEATESSDIDVVLILDELTISDIQTYKKILDGLNYRDKLCGFLSGKNEILNWEPLELFQFYYDTKPIKGSLDVLLNLFEEKDIDRAIKIGVCNIYHSSIHNILYEKSELILKELYKSASFIIQAICFKQTRKYISCKKDLIDYILPSEQVIIKLYLDIKNNNSIDFEYVSKILFEWSKNWINRVK